MQLKLYHLHTLKVEYAELNKFARKKIRRDLFKHKERIRKEIIENNKSLKILCSKLSRGTIQINKIKNSVKKITSRNKILKPVEKFYSKLYQPQLKEVNLRNQVNKKVHRTRLTVVNVGSEDIPDVARTDIHRAFHQMKNSKATDHDGVISEQLNGLINKVITWHLIQYKY